MKEKVFLDTDIVLDFLTDRKPFSTEAASLLSLSESGKIHICISALTVANSYYLLRRFAPNEKVISKLKVLTEIVEVLDLKAAHVTRAFNSGFKDYEDSLQHEAALEDKKIGVIITRNLKDYHKSKLPVMTPDNYLKLFQSI